MSSDIKNLIEGISKKIFVDIPHLEVIEGVLGEWLQLLLVVEKIKKDKQSLESLRKIEKVVETVLNNEEISDRVERAFYDPSCYFDDLGGLRNDSQYMPEWSNEDRKTAYKWWYLHFFFKTLDNNQKYESYLRYFLEYESQLQAKAKGDSYHAISEQDFKKEEIRIFLEILPEIFSHTKFDWENLKKVSFHYSHETILRAYIYGDELLKAIEKLKHFSEKDFLCNRAIWIEKSAKEAISHFNLPAEKILESLKYNFNMVNFFKDDFYGRFICELHKLCLNIPSKIFITHTYINKQNYLNFYDLMNCIIVSIPNVEGKDDEISITIKKDFFIEANEKKLKEKIYDSIDSKIHNALKLDKPSNMQYKWVLPPINMQAISQYYYFSEKTNYILFSRRSEINVSEKLILRGLSFSIWRDKTYRYKRVKIIDAAQEFTGDNLERGSASTIKQSYEAMKRFITNELDMWIVNQANERLVSQQYEEKNVDFLEPMNISFTRNLNKFNKQLKTLGLQSEEQKTNMALELIKIYKKIQQFYDNHSDTKVINRHEIYHFIYEHPDPTKKFYEESGDWLSVHTPEITISEISKLLRNNIDVLI